MNRNVFVLLMLLLMIFSSCGNRKKIIEKPKVAYLVAYMKGNDEKHMYYALAEDGFVFRVLNGGKPVLSASYNDQLVRDPMVLQDKQGIYHLIATVSWSKRPFTVWDSDDLVHWKNERLVDVAPEGATKTWAPEFAYDEENDIYFVHWTGEVNGDWNTASIYYATTKDFKNFSETKLLYKDEVGILDANITKINGLYHLVYRKNGIWVATSKNAQGPYGDAYQLTADNVEGPYVFPLNDNAGYGIVWDYFGNSAGFGLWTTPDFKEWSQITNETVPFYNDKVEFPAGIRHGSIIGLTQEERDKLLEIFPY